MAMFVIAYKQQTDKLTDTSYSLTFIGLAAYAYFTREVQWGLVWLVALAVTLWAMRLGTFLLIRVNKTGKDSRFDEMRSDPVKFAGFWSLQALTVWVVSLGFIVFFEKGFKPDVGLFAAGLVIWGFGLVFEAIADWQKYRFTQNPKNKGKWIESGLWKYSRHPNYFGEILVWYGLWLAISSGLSGGNRWLSVVSPLFIMFLLLFVSGIPILERNADKKWGKQADYKRYKRQTSILLPLPKLGK